MNGLCITALAVCVVVSSFTDGGDRPTTTSQSPEAAKLAAEVIKEFEGYAESAYWDVNAFRAGYGSDTTTLDDGTVISITKDSVVEQDDSERDLLRRVQEFKSVVKDQTGEDLFLSQPLEVQAALTSVAYNYGSLPQSVVDAVETQDVQAIASAVKALRLQDNGINAHRRDQEAALIESAKK
jgi:GH24 family phage-related lysozyme (muramidase)